MRIDTPTAADIGDLARVHVQSWQAAYAGLLDADYLARLSVEERMLSWQRILAAGESSTWVARDDGGRVQAFSATGPAGTGRLRRTAVRSGPSMPTRTTGAMALAGH
jgi:hypothetical protein